MTDSTQNLETETSASSSDKEKLPQNFVRANALRKKAAQFDRDFYFLDRWANNDTTGHIDSMRETLTSIREELEALATCYEEVTPEMMVVRRGVAKVTFEPGMIVEVKEKHRSAYTAMTEDPTHLKVISKRDTHILIECSQGNRFFVPAKEVQPREDA